MASEIQAALALELKAHGITRYVVEHRGRHPKFVFAVDGRQKWLTFSSSPSDCNAHHQAVRQLRRLLGVKREIMKNARPTSEKRAKLRAKHIRPDTTLLAPAPVDPWAVLKPLKERLEKEAAAQRNMQTPSSPTLSDQQPGNGDPSPVKVRLRTPWLGRRQRHQIFQEEFHAAA